MNNFTHRFKYENDRLDASSTVVTSDIILSFDDKGRGILSLDRSMPPKTASIDNEPWEEYYKQSFKDISTSDVRLISQMSIEDATYYTPYAVTFTYNADYILERIKDDTKPINTQWQWFQEDFTTWMNLFRRRCKSVADGTNIGCYEIYPELTKAGVLHAHGLIYINNKYPSISHIMTKAWIDKTRRKGNSMLSTKKKNYRDSYDYAFSICNSVPKWREYITKEQPHMLDNPCLTISEPMEIDYDC